MEIVVFGVLAALALVSAVATVSLRSPLHSAFSLIVCLFALAGLYVTLCAHFLAAMQILVYAGAVMVLFVFVIMLLSLRTDLPDRGRVTLLSVLSGVVVLVMAGKFAKVLLSWPAGSGGAVGHAPVAESFGGTAGVADLLLGQFLMPFELTSLLLLVAVVAAVVIARRRFWREGGER